MRLLGFNITRAGRKDTLVSHSPNWWARVGEAFPGAWQRNIACDAAPSLLAFSAVYACVTRIANDISKMPINLIRRDEDRIWQLVDGASPFWPVLRKPNEYQNRIQFVLCWMISKLLTGNAYVLKRRDARGIVVALYVLDPIRVTVRYTEAGQIFYNVNRDDLTGVQAESNIPASEIIHDLMNPLFHPLCGVSPIYACGMAATMGNRIQQQSANFFDNQSVPGGLLTSDIEISDELSTKFSTRWHESFGGRNKGKVAVLGGGLKYQGLTMSAQDAQLIDQLKWSAEDVARAFGVPLYKINAGPVPTSNNVEALNAQYYQDTLQALIEQFEICLGEGLGLGLTPNIDLGVELDLDALLRMDSATQMDTLVKGVGAGIIAPNEARAKRNLSPVTGGQSPMIQQQNFSLEALAKRDASADPFGTAPPPASSPPSPPDQSTAPAGGGEDAADEAAALDVIRKELKWAA